MNPFIHFCRKLFQVTVCFGLPLLRSLNIQLIKCSHGKGYTGHVSFLVWPLLVNLTDRKTTTLENIYHSSGFPHPSWKPQDKGHTEASKTVIKICVTSWAVGCLLRLTILPTSWDQMLMPSTVQNVSSAATEVLHVSPLTKPSKQGSCWQKGSSCRPGENLSPFQFSEGAHSVSSAQSGLRTMD